MSVLKSKPEEARKTKNSSKRKRTHKSDESVRHWLLGTPLAA